MNQISRKMNREKTQLVNERNNYGINENLQKITGKDYLEYTETNKLFMKRWNRTF